MADVSGVAQALAYTCAGIIYPDGLAGASVTGRQAIIRRGWLLPSDLYNAQSVRNNVDYVTVTTELRQYEAQAEPLGRPWQAMQILPPNVSVSVAGNAVAIVVSTEVAPIGIVGVRVRGADGAVQVATYAAQAGDTAATIAAGLAAALPSASVVGGSLVAAGEIAAEVAGYGCANRVTRRQTQGVTVSVWTSSASARDILGGVLDEALASLGWLSTTDGGRALLSFKGVGDVDTMQNQALYRRDFRYAATFDTTQVQISGQMLFGGGTVNIGPVGQSVATTFGDPDAGVGGQGAAAALAAAAAARPVGPSPYPGLVMDGFGTVVAAG